MCPWHLGRAICSVIWEDDIKPFIVNVIVGTTMVLMGALYAVVTIMIALVLYKILH